MRGDEMPDGLPLPDQMAYTSMRNIYWAYHNKIINRDMAAAEKCRIRREYEQMSESWAFWGRLADHHARILRDTEAAKTVCRKSPTPENSILLCDVLDGIAHLEAPQNDP